MQKFKPQSSIRIFFPTNPPYPRHLVLNSCFGAFHSVWVHLGPFSYCTKLGAKWAELVQLMQKFMPQSCIGFFCNKRTWSTPLDPKLNFCSFRSVWVHLGPFHYCMKLGAYWAELEQLMQNFMPRSRVWIFRNECTRSTPLDPKLLFGSVVFGCIWDRSVALRYSVENGTNCCNKCKSSSHKVALEFFLQQIHPIHSMFLCISQCLGALGTISLLHETRCKMGWSGSINSKARATKSR